MLIQLAITALAIGAFLDGWSTNRAIKRGGHEADKLAAWLFGSATPSPATVYVRGGAVLASEAALALAISRFHHTLGLVVAAALLVQAAVHLIAAIHNNGVNR